MHRLLKRQLKKNLPESLHQNNDLKDLLKSIDLAYKSFDEDLSHTEHILEESSKELFKANIELRKLADEKTQEAAVNVQLLNEIADSISEVIFRTNSKGELIYLNKAWLQITGYSLDESINNSLLEFLLPSEQDKIQEQLNNIYQKNSKCFCITTQILTKNNQIRWIEVNANLSENNGQNHHGLVGTIRDITNAFLVEQENKKLALIAQKTRNIMVITNTEGYITWVNPAFEKLTEYTLNEAVGKKPSSFLQGPKTSPETKKAIATKLQTKSSFYGEIINYSKSGREYWLELYIDPYYNDKGVHQGFIAVENEITERKLQEEKIIESEALLNAIINSVPDLIFYKNKHLQYELANKAMLALSNKTAKELYGKTDAEIFDPKIAQVLIEREKDVFKENLSISEDIFETINGNKLIYQTTKSVLKNDEDNIIGLVGISRDITELRKAEQKTLLSEERLKLATSALNLGVFDWDVTNNKLIWDDAMYHLFELNKKDFAGAYEAFSSCLFPEDAERVNLEVAHAIENDIDFHSTFRIKTKKDNKGVKYIQADAKVFKTNNGNNVRIVGINFNVTDARISAEKEQEYLSNLEKINAELDQFAYVVSHDLKAPLRAINNLSSWIQEDLEDQMDDDIKEQFNLLISRVHRMEDLINGILSYSKAGRIKANNETYDVGENLKELCDTLKTHNKINFIIGENMPILHTEIVAIEQVFANFISNAIKYNDKEQVEVDISCKDEGKMYKFCIKDNGPGIDKEYHDKIFVIFQTLQARDEIESTGVGLAIVKKIVEEKGGKLSIDSSLGAGSTFCFTWPK